MRYYTKSIKHVPLNRNRWLLSIMACPQQPTLCLLHAVVIALNITLRVADLYVTK